MTKKITLLVLLTIFISIAFINTHKIDIVEVGNVKVINAEEKVFFAFEDFFHPELQKLRKREKLDNVVRNSKNEFEKILALKNWTNKQWQQGTPNPYPPFNANTILDLIRSKKTGGWCGQYGVVFAQACLSLGIPVRYLDIMPEGKGGHFVVEVYSRDNKKWVLMDPTLNVYYERNQIPLNVLELHNLKFHDKQNDVYEISESSKTKADLSYYYSFDCWLRNNHLSNPLKTVVTGKVINVIAQRLWYYCPCVSDLKRMEIETKVQMISSDIRYFYWEPDILVIKVLKKNGLKKAFNWNFQVCNRVTKNSWFLPTGEKHGKLRALNICGIWEKD